MAIALVIGTLSAGLATWLVLGYAVGDLALAARDTAFTGVFTNLGKTWASLLLCDIVLAILVVLVPLTSRALSRELWNRVRPRAGVMERTALAAIVTALMVFAWSQAAPMLTRPYFTWHGLPEARAAFDVLAMSAWLLPIIAMAAAAFRAWLELRVGAAESAEAATVERAGHRRALPAPLAIGWKVGLAVFILAGLMEWWVDAVVVATVMAAFLVIREPALRRVPELDRVSRFPILPRLALGAVVSGVVAIILVSALGADSVVRPIVLSTLFSLIVFTLLLPEHVLGRRDTPSPVR